MAMRSGPWKIRCWRKTRPPPCSQTGSYSRHLTATCTDLTLFPTYPMLGWGLLGASAVDSLCHSNAIDALLSNFSVPLQGDGISTRKDRKVGNDM